jgi:hypothetical protein
MLLEDLEQYLKSRAGITAPVFRDFNPSDPDEVIILTEYAGPNTQTGVEAIRRRVQVLCRSKTYEPAKTAAWKIYKLLDNPIERTHLADSGRWMNCTALQTPHRLSIDEKGRTIFGFNLAIVTTSD